MKKLFITESLQFFLSSYASQLWLVPIKVGKAEDREANNRQSQRQQQLEATHSTFLPILFPAEFCKGRTETKERNLMARSIPWSGCK